MKKFIRGISFVFVMVLSFVGSISAEPIVYVGNFKDNTVSVIDISKSKSIATIPVAAGPHGMVVSKDGSKLFVSGDATSEVTVIDTGSLKVSGIINVGKTPHGLAISPDDRFLLVCINGEDKIAFVDRAKLTVAYTVEVAKPHTVSVSPDGKTAYVSSQEPGGFKLAVIDIEGHKLLRNVPLEKTPRDLEYSYDGKFILFTQAGVNEVQILNPVNDKITAHVKTGASPHYVNYFRNTAEGMAVVQGPGELLLFNPVTFKPFSHIKVGNQPHWLAVSSNGVMAFVTNEGSDSLSVIDLKSGKVKDVIPTGAQPRKVVFQPWREMTMSNAKVRKVILRNFAFSPSNIQISAGSSVLWENKDGSSHTITFKDGTKGSDTMFPGDTFIKIFDRAGTYDYFCSMHNYMTGTITVVEK